MHTINPYLDRNITSTGQKSRYTNECTTLSRRFGHSLYLISMDEETECRSLYISMAY